MKVFGLDIGTKNIVLAYEDENGGKIRHEVNGYMKLPSSDGFAKNLLLNSDVPYMERDGDYIALGTKAEDLSYVFNRALERPMKDGVITGEEDLSMEVMTFIIHSILEDVVTEENSILYYCIPADALNRKTNVAFHDKVMGMILEQYKGANLKAYSVNEARAIVIRDIPDKTGIGISFGSGMVNISYCMFGMEVFNFSICGSGDKIDLDTAMKFGYDPDNPKKDYKETPTSVCRRKEGRLDNQKFNLIERPDDMVGKALYINYELMIDGVVNGIVSGFEENKEKARIDRPIPIVLAGGTSMPEGFDIMVKNAFEKADPPFKIGNVTRSDEPLYAVAEGCLEVARMHEGD